jgi:hypothetical protein
MDFLRSAGLRFLTVLAVSVILTGCSGTIVDQQGNQKGTFQSVRNWDGSTTIVITPSEGGGSFTPSSGGNTAPDPGNIRNPGTNQPTPANTTAPADSEELVQMFKDKYGLIVGGSGADGKNLQKFADTLEAAWVPEKTQGLSSVTFVDMGNQSPSVLGVWGGLENTEFAGELAHEGHTSNPEIAYLSYNYIARAEGQGVDQHTMIHELSHHQCEGLNRNFGNQLSGALQQSTQGTASRYAEMRGPGSADYKAEALTLMLLGRQESRRYYQSFQPNDTAKSLVRQEFGRMVWN